MADIYEIRDLYGAALLYAMKMKLVEVKREGKRCWFVFKDQEQCDKLYQQYLSKSIKVNAKEYADSIRTLKDIVFTQ